VLIRPNSTGLQAVSREISVSMTSICPLNGLSFWQDLVGKNERTGTTKDSFRDQRQSYGPLGVENKRASLSERSALISDSICLLAGNGGR